MFLDFSYSLYVTIDYITIALIDLNSIYKTRSLEFRCFRCSHDVVIAICNCNVAVTSGGPDGFQYDSAHI